MISLKIKTLALLNSPFEQPVEFTSGTGHFCWILYTMVFNPSKFLLPAPAQGSNSTVVY